MLLPTSSAFIGVVVALGSALTPLPHPAAEPTEAGMAELSEPSQPGQPLEPVQQRSDISQGSEEPQRSDTPQRFGARQSSGTSERTQPSRQRVSPPDAASHRTRDLSAHKASAVTPSPSAASRAQAIPRKLETTTKSPELSAPAVLALPSLVSVSADKQTKRAHRVATQGTQGPISDDDQPAALKRAVRQPSGGAATFGGIKTVGIIAPAPEPGQRPRARGICSASSVIVGTHTVVMTAAHCIQGSYTRRMVYIPQPQRDGSYLKAPFGVFPVSVKAGRNKLWSLRQVDSDRSTWQDDVAFVKVDPNSTGRSLASVGANRLNLNASLQQNNVSLIGYPHAIAPARRCDTNTTASTFRPIEARPDTGYRSDVYRKIDCVGYPGGTSGSPFIVDLDYVTGQGTVVGIIGGPVGGGDTADVSYSSDFRNAKIKDLVARVAREAG